MHPLASHLLRSSLPYLVCVCGSGGDMGVGVEARSSYQVFSITLHSIHLRQGLSMPQNLGFPDLARLTDQQALGIFLSCLPNTMFIGLQSQTQLFTWVLRS